MRQPRRSAVPFALAATAAIALVSLAGCGGGGGADAPSAPPAPPVTTPTAISGSVAIGAPITQGVLRVLDADGAVVAENVAVAADGTYAPITLTGRAPWRIEACGYAGANWRCMVSVAQAAGTANVTPLTTALVTLASGQAPEALMQDGASAPGADALASAQGRLQQGLAGTLSDAGLPSNVDFTTASLAAGSRTGYDRVLDAVSVTTGTDDGAFVQVTPRLGDGNLYITPTTTTGTITTPTNAADLPLGGLTTLFAGISHAMASANACADANTGVATFLATDARMNIGDGGSAHGRADVGAGLCQFFGMGDDGQTPMWGASLVSPTLGKCDFSGTDPLCAVSFVLQAPDGGIQNVGSGMAVVYRDARWQFYGDLLPVQINANAAAQRSVRVDDPTTPVRYSRALQFDIAVTPGIACAQVSQHAVDGSPVTVAYYKVYDPSAPRMSLWSSDGFGNAPSTDPANGSLRSGDDTWVGIPDGDAGDDVVRNFYRGGRTVTVSIYADAACATPAVVEGKSAFEVDVDGVPPVWSAMSTLPWGELTDAAKASFEAFTLDGGHAGSIALGWSFADGSIGYDEATFCTAGSCGDGSDARLGQNSVRPTDRTATVSLHAPANAVRAGDFKEFILGGRDGAGMNIESEFTSCTSHAAGSDCNMN